MSLILNTSLPKFKKGYPTVSDKYHVNGGILNQAAAASIEVGTILALTSTNGVYDAVTSTTTVDEVAGVALAPNVKVTDIMAGETVAHVKPGEAVNVCFEGLVAVEVESAVIANIVPGAKVGLTAGKLVVGTADNAIDGWFFTGSVDGTLAEIDIRR